METKEDNMKKLYLLEIWHDVTITHHGPLSELRMKNLARKIKERDGDETGLFWLEIKTSGDIETGDFGPGYFEEE
jgi:hypothetical protein